MEHGGGEISGFLSKLSEDRNLQQEYTKDPHGTLQRAGVSQDAIDAITSGDLGRVKGVLERELGPGGPYMCFMVVFSSAN